MLRIAQRHGYIHDLQVWIIASSGIQGQTSSQGYAANCAAVREADFREQLGAIQAPTLIVCGTAGEEAYWIDCEGAKAILRAGFRRTVACTPLDTRLLGSARWWLFNGA